MCMLCVIPPNVTPSREKLENSALNNPHGFGWAIVIPEENRILSERTMNADDSINGFLSARKIYQTGHAMWHARFATHGTMTVDNCHPFMVGNDPQTYLGHNGVLSVIEDKDDVRSDTRIFAEDILPAMGGVTALDNEQIFNILSDFATGSKVCVLTVDPKAEYECYIINEKSGAYDDDKVWWSNDSCYLDYYGGFGKSKSALAYLGEDRFGELWCDVCLWTGKDADTDGYTCPMCTACFDYVQPTGDCLCHQPAKPSTSHSQHGSQWSTGWWNN